MSVIASEIIYYVLFVSLSSFYIYLGLMAITVIFNLIFYLKKSRHLIKIYMVNMAVLFIMTISLGVILMYKYGGITLTTIQMLLNDFSITDAESITDIVIFLFIVNWDTLVLGMTMFILGFVLYVSKLCVKSNDDTPSSLEEEIIYKQFAFVIVCHNSSLKIEETINQIQNKCLNRMDSEYYIFISDNGSTKEEQLKTKAICDRLKCSYLHLSIGSKTLSQFATANYIKIYYPTIKYIVALDDDIIIPSNWNFTHISKHFSYDPDVVALALPLISSNRVNYSTESQNFEYLLAGHNKIVQSAIGGCLFGSGGFTVYLLDYFLEIVTHHTTAFKGEDLQLGLVCYTIQGKQCFTTKITRYRNPKIACCSQIFVPTDVPVHLYHTHKESCPCGEPSLFKQRVVSWEVTRHRFIKKFFRLITARTPLTWRNFIIKCYSIYEIILILNDWAIMIYLIIMLAINNDGLGIVRTFFVTITWNIPFLILFKMLFLNKFDIQLFIVISYNFYYKMMYNWIIRICAVFYNVFVYWPDYKEPSIILKQYIENDELRSELHRYWKMTPDIETGVYPMDKRRGSGGSVTVSQSEIFSDGVRNCRCNYSSIRKICRCTPYFSDGDRNCRCNNSSISKICRCTPYFSDEVHTINPLCLIKLRNCDEMTIYSLEPNHKRRMDEERYETKVIEIIDSYDTKEHIKNNELTEIDVIEMYEFESTTHFSPESLEIIDI